MLDFTDKHRSRTGLVTNQPEWLTHGAPVDMNRPFGSVVVCGRDDCVSRAISYIAGRTNETATYVPDDQRKL